jgi:hypothetical protein
MKKSILILAISLFAASAWADDLTVIQRQKKQVQAQPRPVVIQPRHGEGSVQWAFRLGNPLQAINPFAPAEYGDGSDFVLVYDEYDPSQRTPPGKAQGHGVKLFGFTF